MAAKLLQVGASLYGLRGATMSAADATTSLSRQISLRFVELRQFRRLGKVQLEVDPKTTILVGANNSGKHQFWQR